MTMTRFRNLTSLMLTLVGLLSACAALKDSPEDNQITADVRARLRAGDRVAPGSIDVSIKNHVVFLSGFVGAPLEVDDAETIARRVPGVTRVVNGLVVE